MRGIGCMALSLLVVLAPGCTEGFDTESAFATEQYLCDPESASAWAARIEACRSAFEVDASCVGVLSLQGQLQGVDVVLDTDLETAEFEDVTRFDLSRSRDEVSLIGFAPYFGFELRIDSIGGAVPDAATPRPLAVGPTPVREARYDDEFVQVAMRLAAGGDSADVNFLSGAVDIDVQELNESAGRFNLVGGRAGDAIEGCFFAFDAMPTVGGETP